MASHAPRRPHIPGGQPRKLYPYTRAEQRGTPVEKFVARNTKGLESEGNRPGALNAAGRLSKNAIKDKVFRKKWSALQSRGTNGRAVTRYLKKNGGSRGRARKILIGRHEVSFGADPKSR